MRNACSWKDFIQVHLVGNKLHWIRIFLLYPYHTNASDKTKDWEQCRKGKGDRSTQTFRNLEECVHINPLETIRYHSLVNCYSTDMTYDPNSAVTYSLCEWDVQVLSYPRVIWVDGSRHQVVCVLLKSNHASQVCLCTFFKQQDKMRNSDTNLAC